MPGQSRRGTLCSHLFCAVPRLAWMQRLNACRFNRNSPVRGPLSAPTHRGGGGGRWSRLSPHPTPHTHNSRKILISLTLKSGIFRSFFREHCGGSDGVLDLFTATTPPRENQHLPSGGCEHRQFRGDMRKPTPTSHTHSALSVNRNGRGGSGSRSQTGETVDRTFRKKRVMGLLR